MMFGGAPFHPPARTREASLSEAEWLLRIVEAVGDLASEYNRGAAAGVDAAIDRAIRLLCQWRVERGS